MTTIEPNDIGLTNTAAWSDFGDTLIEQLDKAGIAHEQEEIPHLLHWHAGAAYLLFYLSPKTGLPTTVLCTPIQYDIDGFAEEYFYFSGLDKAAALEIPERGWLDRYNRCCELVGRNKPTDIHVPVSTSREGGDNGKA